MWTLIALVDFEIVDGWRQSWISEELHTGTLRQCMECAATLVPKYRGYGLTLDSITKAWDEIFCNNLDSSWLDCKREYFFIKRVEGTQNAVRQTGQRKNSPN